MNEKRPLHCSVRRGLLKAATAAITGHALGVFTGSGRASAVVEVQEGGTDLLDLTATQVVRLIQRGELRAERYALRLLDQYRARKSLNALTWFNEARLLEDAQRIDVRRSRGERIGLLAGLPVVIKDNIDVAGLPTAAATATLKHNIATRHAPVVDSLFRNGAVLFGKANMHELAGGGTTSNSATGFAANPYDPKRIPGGSSGGTAAAIAARMAPAGLGSDTAGSVRIPSALCGIAGLRPTTYGRKLYPDEGLLPLARDLDTVGPMARTVADVALLHAAITGERMVSGARLRRMRIGMPRQPYWEDLDPTVAQVLGFAIDRLREAGAVFVDVEVDGYYKRASDLYNTLVMHGIKEDLGGYLSQINSRRTADEVVSSIASRDTRALFERARDMKFTSAQIEEARTTQRDRVVKAYEEMFRNHGLTAIVFPTEPIVAPLINADGDTIEDQIELNGRKVSEVLTLIRNTHVTGALGAPGLSVPAGLNIQGLPVGFEFDGLPGRDREMLALGIAVEETLGNLPPPRERRA